MSSSQEQPQPEQGSLFDLETCPQCKRETANLQRVGLPNGHTALCCQKCLPVVRKERTRMRAKLYRNLTR
ncbi:hypothetical protein [Ktedonobacter racemifer]|uniref:Uncharacterized protein n=1 Tax=Ktedonobacter racemifer DSM 44963 TaxID=485913 RepID=D6U8T2_KTERA|nr:hypothetical protein [Ktedonobacter racemifer]EFH79642.1 conserved hypothetical protein [Ktedonobacter racemifer DSM 44963]